MAFPIKKARKQRAIQAETTRAVVASPPSSLPVVPHNRRLTFLLIACAAAFIFSFWLIRRFTPSPLTEPMLAGRWQLRSLGKEAIGPASALVSQELTLKNGRLRGETVLRAETEAGTLAMPFPDASVSRVTASADGQQVRVAWEGTYRIVKDKLLELQVGKARYRLTANFDAPTRQLTFSPDAILTYPGAAHYAPAAPQTEIQVARRPR